MPKNNTVSITQLFLFLNTIKNYESGLLNIIFGFTFEKINLDTQNNQYVIRNKTRNKTQIVLFLDDINIFFRSNFISQKTFVKLNFGRIDFNNFNNRSINGYVYFNEGLKIILKRAFYCCKELRNIYIPNSVNIIEEKAFYKCVSLTTINIPKDILEIKTSAFDMCINLTDIVLPEGLKIIHKKAFSKCCKLRSITFPSTLEQIKGQAFLGCIGLTKAIFKNSSKHIQFYCDIFEGCDNIIYLEIPEKYRLTIVPEIRRYLTFTAALQINYI